MVVPSCKCFSLSPEFLGWPSNIFLNELSGRRKDITGVCQLYISLLFLYFSSLSIFLLFSLMYPITV